MRHTSAVMLASVLVLVTVGAVMVFSTTVSGASDLVRWRGWMQYAWLVLGVGAMFAMMRVPFQRIWDARWLVAIASAGLLLAVFVPGIGRRVHGAHRWLTLGEFSFQPSEVAKIVLVLIVSGFLARRADTAREDFRRYALAMAATGAAVGLVVIEPDFGTACLLAAISILLAIVAGVRWRFVGPTILAGVTAAVALVVTSPYRLRRLVGFLHWRENLSDSGYHIHQSLMAIGSGGALGVGPGAGQQKLDFLPEAHNDFIFSVIGEELGLAGTLGVLALFFVFFLCGFRTFRAMADRRKGLVALGITLTITLQALMNVAVVTATVPTKGIALPFVSKGGSALVILLIGVGILLRLAREAEGDCDLESESVQPGLAGADS